MYKCFAVIFTILPLYAFVQNSNSDTVSYYFARLTNDTNKVKLLHSFVSDKLTHDPMKALELAKEEVKLCHTLNYKIERAYDNLAWLYKSTGNYKKSLDAYFLAENYAQKLKSPENEKILAEVYNGLASVYCKLNNYDLAIIKGKRSQQYYTLLKDTIGLAYSTLNLGNYFYYKGDYSNAMFHYKRAEYYLITQNDSLILPNCYNCLGGVNFQLKKYEDALGYYLQFYNHTLKNNPNDLLNIAVALQNIGQVNAQMGNFEKGIESCKRAAELFLKLNDTRNLYNTYESIADYYAKIGDYKSSNSYYSSYVHLKDSLFDEDTKNTIHEMSIKYESDKKEQENQVLSLANKNKQLIIYFAFGGCALLSGLVFFIFKGYRTKKKANFLLREKNLIIEQQKALVEEQHQDITDSIKYAQRIQGAILPPKNLWEKILPNSFVLYMPKDILSGDFYWIEETKDYVYVAAADCTGHGVPGALISIVNYNLLNKAVLEKGLVLPSDILDAVNLWLTESLHQTYRESAVRDGMDVTLIAIHKHSNEVLFTGANNPIYIISNGELKQIKGDKFPVGAFVEDKIQKFTTKRFTVEKGDFIYLFSDGFADQFGGGNGKKYKYAPFQQKLVSISNLPLSEQRKLMKNEFNRWKGDLEQVDDVLLIGIRID